MWIEGSGPSVEHPTTTKLSSSSIQTIVRIIVMSSTTIDVRQESGRFKATKVTKKTSFGCSARAVVK